MVLGEFTLDRFDEAIVEFFAEFLDLGFVTLFVDEGLKLAGFFVESGSGEGADGGFAEYTAFGGPENVGFVVEDEGID